MLDFLIYTLEAGIIFAVLTAIYKYVYSGASYHRWERGYILASTAISYLLPLLKVRFYTEPKPVRPHDSIVEIVSRNPIDVVTITHERTVVGVFDTFVHSQIFENIIAILFAVYMAGVVVKMVSFVNGLRKTLSLRRGEFSTTGNNIRIYRTELNTVAFSFFRSIFLGKKAAGLQDAELSTVVAHETNHIMGCHSIDTIVLGFYSVVQWINPMVRLAQKSSRMVCENIADAGVTDSAGLTDYSRLILRLGLQTSKRTENSKPSSGALLSRIAQLLSSDGERIRRIRFICTIPLLALIIAAYLILAGMANPISQGLPVPVEGQYTVSAGYFENQRFLDTDGMLYNLSHRQMDIIAEDGARIFAPECCTVVDASESGVVIKVGLVEIAIGGIMVKDISRGDTLSKRQTIGSAIGSSPLFLRVVADSELVNPELIFSF